MILWSCFGIGVDGETSHLIGDVVVEFTESLKECLKWTASKLHGADRRELYARVVDSLGRGGQRKVQQELGWSRTTARKGAHEFRTGIVCDGGSQQRGPKSFEERLPNLRSDISSIVERHCQTDPTLETTRLYRRVTAKEVRLQLIEMGYEESELPSEETIRVRLNEMGYPPAKVQKSKPKKNPTDRCDL